MKFLFTKVMCICLALILVIAIASCSSVGSPASSALPTASASAQAKTLPYKNLFEAFEKARAAKILGIIPWRAAESVTLWMVLHKTEQGEEIGSPESSLSVFNEQGDLLVHYPNVRIRNMAQFAVLKNERTQLVLGLENDGRPTLLYVLDYDGKKINTLFKGWHNVGGQVRLITQEGVNNIALPDSIILSNTSIPANPERAVSEVYIFRDGQYRSAGRLPMIEMDKPLTELLRRSHGRNK